eukprot:6177716-Pleurochrysis_carterae.AAC.5
MPWESNVDAYFSQESMEHLHSLHSGKNYFKCRIANRLSCEHTGATYAWQIPMPLVQTASMPKEQSHLSQHQRAREVFKPVSMQRLCASERLKRPAGMI